MPSRAVVLLAYHYPPMLGPASARAASFAHHLPASGWDPTVVSVRRGLYHRQDAPDRLPDVPTLRTRSPEPARLFGALRGRVSGAPGGAEVEEVPEARGGPATQRLRRLLRDYAYIPDGQVGWIPFAIAGLRHAIRDLPPPAVLFSSSVPYSAHLACFRVAKDEGIPWVAELRDPWALIEDEIRPRSGARKRIDATLERRVVNAANAVVVTTELTRAAMAAAYPDLPKERIQVVRNGFEPSVGETDPPGREQPLQLVQAGSVPEGTALEPLLRGIGRVARAHPGKVRLRVLAPRERWLRSAAAVGSPEWLNLAGLVSPQEAADAIRRASVNVLLRPGREHRQYVAAKLTEYLGACRPILAIVDPAGEMASLARRYGDVRLVAPYDEGTVATAVKELLARHRQGALTEAPAGPGDVADLTRAAQAARLAQVLESAIESAGGTSGR